MGETSVQIVEQPTPSTVGADADFPRVAIELGRRNRIEIGDLVALACAQGIDEQVVAKAARWAVASQRVMASLHGDRRPSDYPLAVASTIAALNLDRETPSKAESVVAALLHEAVSLDLISVADIQEDFGLEAAVLTDEVARITRIKRNIEAKRELTEKEFSYNQTQFELGMEAICSLPDSSRVIPIKVTDCLQRMRTLDCIKDGTQGEGVEERFRIALFADRIYLPLTRELGWDEISTELEQLIMGHIDPTATELIGKKMQGFRNEKEIIKRIGAKITGTIRPRRSRKRQEIVNDAKSEKIVGRVKSDYAIWKKMLIKQAERTHARQEAEYSYTVRPEMFDELFSDIHDKVAFRCCVNGGSDGDSYRIASVLQSTFMPISEVYDDRIASPRGKYRVLQIGIVMGYRTLGNIEVEVQVYKDTDEEGSYSGPQHSHSYYKRWKAHFSYLPPSHHAQKSRSYTRFDDAGLLNDIRERYRARRNGHRIVAYPQPRRVIPIGSDGAYVPIKITPGADPTKPTLPTIGDFAFAVHSDVARHAVAANINGVVWDLTKPGPVFDWNLRTGDRIELFIDDDYDNPERWTGHLRVKSSREKLGPLLRQPKMG